MNKIKKHVSQIDIKEIEVLTKGTSRYPDLDHLQLHAQPKLQEKYFMMWFKFVKI